ncbi:MAG: Cytochrome c oxidase subunit CcoP (EC [uncultured Thiotrichaceae bacterium]|uniref:Cbb3-type cytochrome c oxidase subunit n=1 Tax=uncultured Thiotrichaceae bacterium TaxID=298394 RepID=A0A6S6TMB0_9GAMM|nr:MAG: Cytochrome c oxidase subunit CcoP (EC [uncultured Thiotrichaceae bacterium]
MAEHEVIKDPITGAETTGHVWDDTLMEFNNPLPLWWVWAFYGTVIFSIVYWILFPAWPIGFLEKGYTTGIKTISYEKNGEEVTRHWNTRSLLWADMHRGPEEAKRQEMLKVVAETPFDDIAKDPQKAQFVQAYGKNTFADNCAGCHQAGGQGVIGHYPNIADDAWLWGSDVAQIEATIRGGRNGMMPAHKDILTPEEIGNVSNYVLSLSGETANAEAVTAGKLVFDTKGCAGCHTPAGTGMAALGAANLTDKIWTQANVPGADTLEDKVAAVSGVISGGIQRQMPAFDGRLSENEIKVLVSYVKLMSAQ